mgnify:FL=1
MQNTKLHSTKFLDMIQTIFTDKKGQKKTWFWVQRPNSQNAVVIVATVGDKLVVIKEFRVPISNYEIGLPAGLIDPGYDIKTTVIKELKEETGLDFVKFIKEPSPIVFNSAGLTDEGCSIVYVEATGKISNANLQDSEDIETYLLTKDQVKDLMNQARHDRNICIGAKAWLVFENFVGE